MTCRQIDCHFYYLSYARFPAPTDSHVWVRCIGVMPAKADFVEQVASQFLGFNHRRKNTLDGDVPQGYSPLIGNPAQFPPCGLILSHPVKRLRKKKDILRPINKFSDLIETFTDGPV